MAAFTVRMISATSHGMVPPLVSHSTSVSAPPRTAACQRFEGIGGISFIAVEEMLGVVDDAPALRFEIGQTLLDDAQVVVEGGPQHFGDVQRPRFAEDGADRACAN